MNEDDVDDDDVDKMFDSLILARPSSVCRTHFFRSLSSLLTPLLALEERQHQHVGWQSHLYDVLGKTRMAMILI